MHSAEEISDATGAVSTGSDDTLSSSATTNRKTSTTGAIGAEGTAGVKKEKKRSKYRHVAAYHAKVRHSSLTREPNVTASFLGFRNLMVIVLGEIDLTSLAKRAAGKMLMSSLRLSGNEPSTHH